MKNELNAIHKLSDTSSFAELSEFRQNEIRQRTRLLMNDISMNADRFFPKDRANLINVFSTDYEVTAKQLRNMGIPIQRLTQKTSAEIRDIHKQLAKSITDSIETATKLTDMRFEVAQNFIKAIDKVNPNAFRPRATLLNFTNKFQDRNGKLVLMKEFRQTQRDVIDYLRNDVLPNGLLYEEAVPRLVKMMDKHFPDGKVAIPMRIKGQLVNRHIDIGDYAETWFHDAHASAHTEATLSAMSVAGVDLVDIVGGITDNPICDPYIMTRTFSLTGETKGYPILGRYPPFHPNCSKRMVVSGKNREVIKLD